MSVSVKLLPATHFRGVKLCKNSEVAWVIACKMRDGKWSAYPDAIGYTRGDAWENVLWAHAPRQRRTMQRQGYKAIEVKLTPI